MEGNAMRKKLLMMLALVLVLGLPVRLALAQGEGAQANSSQAEEGSQPGLLTPDVQQAVWVICIFIVLVLILYPTAWKNVLAGLKAREDRIRGDIAAAEAARLQAETSLKEYNSQLSAAEERVKQLLSQAAVDADKLGASIRLRAQQESEEIKDRALKDIDASRRQAMAEIYEQTANLSTTIAEKILRRNLSADDQRELVNESLKQLQMVQV